MIRTSTANWQGSGKEGKGTLSVQSGLIANQAYTYATRFENAHGTNPEELVAAAHAACYSMKLSFVLGAAGFTPDNIDTACSVTLENGAITKSHLVLKASVPGITQDKFLECANDAKLNCPISKSLTAEISLEATLA